MCQRRETDADLIREYEGRGLDPGSVVQSGCGCLFGFVCSPGKPGGMAKLSAENLWRYPPCPVLPASHFQGEAI